MALGVGGHPSTMGGVPEWPWGWAGTRVVLGGVAKGGAPSGHGKGGVSAIHRGQLPSPEGFPTKGGAHGRTNLLHRGQHIRTE